MKLNALNGAYAVRRSAQSYLCASEETPTAGGSCGSACGAGDDSVQPETKPTACGSACGAGDK